ncbi:hypothetical protein AALP_AA8G248400 [Arabis alpina]|uniref:U1-C C2H2-type zinc finger domain-containing protein n=1 Tax=Arabis alpina TaxID=50452 RepID=A0A087G986_ARAAL|nr:hypothetical protein AALP_AA8G248400 [Arabis alpina]
MPWGKYFCDYCEKEFQDTQVARKRHLQSKPHLRAKALWYSSSPVDAANPQIAPKALCNRFVTSNSCRYLHPNNNNIPGVPHSGFVNQASSLNHRLKFQTGDFVTGRPGTSCFDLPPSLKPPPQHGFPQLPSIDWG